MTAFGFDPDEIGPKRPLVVRHSGQAPPTRRRRIGWAVLIGLVILLVVARQLLSLLVSYLFFSSAHATVVFWTPLVAQLVLFVIGFVLTGLLVGASVPAWRAAVRSLDQRGDRSGLWIGVAITVVAALIGGAALAGQWQDMLLWLHHHDFGATDPVFGKDYGFYIFTLPVLDALQAIGWAAAIIALLGATAIAAACAVAINAPDQLPFPLQPPRGRSAEDGLRIAVRHAGMALVGVFLMAALGAHYGAYHLVTSQHDNFWGLDATERNVVRPVLGALQFIAVGFAIITAAVVARRWRREAGVSGGILSGALVGWLVVAGVVQGIPAAIYQGTSVNPNAQSAQAPAIADFLHTSRYGWALDDGNGSAQGGKDVSNRPFASVGLVSLNDVTADQSTLRNVRIQDYRQLPDAFNQIDRKYGYQSFPTITVDRYPDPQGAETEVMLGPREISSNNLPAENFVNRSLTYTHGYGITAASVSQTGDGGKPYLYVGQYPNSALTPDAPPGLTFNGSPAADPRIYCGVSTDQAVVADTKQPEFDYPARSGDHYSHGGNVQGIDVGNPVSKLAVSLESFGGTDLFLTSQLTSQSRVLIHRTIADRVQTLAPFLTVDKDPYVVADPSSGHLLYVADAYVKSDRFPESFQLSDGTSYMRNAVKAVVDSRTCATTLYAVDMNEPLTATYNEIYPGLLTPLDRMPSTLRAHLRYPEDLFQAQAQVYASIHVSDPSLYFNNSNKWRVAQELVEGTTAHETQAYYVELTLPGDTHPSFVLLQTFSPASGNANNMTSWLAAKSDYTTTNHPMLISVPLQGTGTVEGPLQFDNRINTNGDLSKQISLLNTQGSRVIQGNVIVLPVNKDAFLYVRPLYVAATGTSGNSFPQLQYVIVGDGSNVAFDTTFAGAMQKLLHTSAPVPGIPESGAPPVPSSGPSSSPTSGPSPSPGTPSPSSGVAPSLPPSAAPVVQDLVQLEQQYQTDVGKQDFTAAGKDQDAIKADVAKLNAILGTTPRSSPSP